MLRREMEEHRLALTRTDWTGEKQLVPYDASVANNPQVTVRSKISKNNTQKKRVPRVTLDCFADVLFYACGVV